MHEAADQLGGGLHTGGADAAGVRARRLLVGAPARRSARRSSARSTSTSSGCIRTRRPRIRSTTARRAARAQPRGDRRRARPRRRRLPAARRAARRFVATRSSACCSGRMPRLAARRRSAAATGSGRAGSSRRCARRSSAARVAGRGAASPTERTRAWFAGHARTRCCRSSAARAPASGSRWLCSGTRSAGRSSRGGSQRLADALAGASAELGGDDPSPSPGRRRCRRPDSCSPTSRRASWSRLARRAAARPLRAAAARATATGRARSRSTGRSTARSRGARTSAAAPGPSISAARSTRSRRSEWGAWSGRAGRAAVRPARRRRACSTRRARRRASTPPGRTATCRTARAVDMTERIEAQVERFAPGFRELVLARHTMGPARARGAQPQPRRRRPQRRRDGPRPAPLPPGAQARPVPDAARGRLPLLGRRRRPAAASTACAATRPRGSREISSGRRVGARHRLGDDLGPGDRGRNARPRAGDLRLGALGEPRRARRRALATGRPAAAAAPSKLDDPPQKIGFVDDKWFLAEAAGPSRRSDESAIYLAIPLRNVGSGIAVLHGWTFFTTERVGTTPEHRDPSELTASARPLHPGGGRGLLARRFRDPEAPSSQRPARGSSDLGLQ